MNKETQMRRLIESYDTAETFPAFTGGASDEQIDKVAQELLLSISGSFRTFCSLLGSQDSFGFCGVDIKWEGAGTAWQTSLCRKEMSLPDNFLIVWKTETDEQKIYLDTSQGNIEHPAYSFFYSNWQESEKIFDSFYDLFEYSIDDEN